MEEDTARVLYYSGMDGFHISVDKKHIRTFYGVNNFSIKSFIIVVPRGGLSNKALWHMDIDKARKFVKSIELICTAINDVVLKMTSEKRTEVTKKDFKRGSVYLRNTSSLGTTFTPISEVFRCTGKGAFVENGLCILQRQTHADMWDRTLLMDTIPDTEKFTEVTDDEYNMLLSLKDKIIELDKNFINTSVMYHKETDFKDATDNDIK